MASPTATLGVSVTFSPTAGTAPGDPILSEVRVARRIFTPEGRVNRKLEITFRSRLSAGEIQATVFDLQGRRQASPEVQADGAGYRVVWDGRTEAGRNAAPGIYVYEIKAGNSDFQGAVVLAR